MTSNGSNTGISSYEVEYSTLRGEILQNHKNCLQIVAFAITGTAVIFGLAVKAEENWLFMLPLTILVPCLYLYVNQVTATFRLGSYIRVFLEKNNEALNYETYWSQYRSIEKGEENGKNVTVFRKARFLLYENASLAIFYLLSAACIFLGLVALDNCTLVESLFYVLFSVAATVFLYFPYRMNRKAVHETIKQDTRWVEARERSQ